VADCPPTAATAVQAAVAVASRLLLVELEQPIKVTQVATVALELIVVAAVVARMSQVRQGRRVGTAAAV